MNIEERLLRLEQENARLRRQVRGVALLVPLLLGVGTFCLFRAPVARSQQAEGKNLGRITATELVIEDAKKIPRIILRAPGEAAGANNPLAAILIADDKGYPNAAMLHFRQAAGYWASFNYTGDSFVQLMSSAGDQAGYLSIRSGGGSPQAGFFVDKNRTNLSLTDARTGNALLRGQIDGGVPLLSLGDRGGAAKFFVKLDEKNRPIFRVQEEEPKELTGVSSPKLPSVKFESKEWTFTPGK